MLWKNLISSPKKAIEYITHLAEQGYKEIYCLEVIECKDAEKVFNPRKKTVPIQGLFICPTLDNAIAVAKDVFKRKCGVVCIRRTPKKVKSEWQFPGKVFDFGSQRDYYFYEEDIRKLGEKAWERAGLNK